MKSQKRWPRILQRESACENCSKDGLKRICFKAKCVVSNKWASGRTGWFNSGAAYCERMSVWALACASARARTCLLACDSGAGWWVDRSSELGCSSERLRLHCNLTASGNIRRPRATRSFTSPSFLKRITNV